MGLRIKFNLVMLSVFAAALLVAGWVARGTLHHNAEAEVLRQAGLIMETAAAVRSYNSTHITPHLEPVRDGKFVPQTVPSFAVGEIYQTIQKKYPGYVYRDATLNPTNPRDRALDWEASLVNQFRAHDDLKELAGRSDDVLEPMLYLARPIRIQDPKCLSCHTSPEAAPAGLVGSYGLVGGFGWTLNEVVGAQVVTVPTRIPYEHATQALNTFLLTMAGTFTAILLLLNLMLDLLVVRPLRLLADQVERISRGAQDIPEFSEQGSDELTTVRKAVNRLHRSLKIAMDMVGKRQP